MIEFNLESKMTLTLPLYKAKNKRALKLPMSFFY